MRHGNPQLCLCLSLQVFIPSLLFVHLVPFICSSRPFYVFISSPACKTTFQRRDPAHNWLWWKDDNRGMSGGNLCYELSGRFYQVQLFKPMQIFTFSVCCGGDDPSMYGWHNFQVEQNLELKLFSTCNVINPFELVWQFFPPARCRAQRKERPPWCSAGTLSSARGTEPTVYFSGWAI